ncbi:MAG TPA: ABC transporter ATP-binding protein [Xanthomonadales bacterium]|nr:ABC transporter ATP-binding protein [Xanthomonadales bacterium]
MKFSTLLQHITPRRGTLALIVVLLLASSVVALANPWIAGRLTQFILEPASSVVSLRFILLAWLGLLFLRSLLNFATQYLVGITGQKMSTELRVRIYDHLQILPLEYFQARKSGDLLALLTKDAEYISTFITETLVQLLPLLMTFFGAMAIMVWLDPVIALLAAVLLPVYYLAMKIIGRRIRPLTRQWIDKWSGMVALVQENLSLVPAIKAFSREPVELQRFTVNNSELLGLARSQIFIHAIMSPTIAFLAGAGLLLLLWVGLGHIESGQLEPADLVSLLLYAMLLTQPISGLAGVYGQVMLTRGAAERLLDFFAVNPEPLTSGGPPLLIKLGKIEFEHIRFAYPGRNPLFLDLDLVIEAGETIAITGPNGAGKSTLAHLLMRFMEPNNGRILIDGQDISKVDLISLRRQIGLVSQHTLLLNGTIAENICYGNPNASEAEMKKAAMAARADEFIKALPEGYATLIGDQGVRLSGGQRQRLSLARTLLKNPPILILDEATAMFDPDGERDFLKESELLFHARTVIMITHRPASLALADRTVRLHGGSFQALN